MYYIHLSQSYLFSITCHLGHGPYSHLYDIAVHKKNEANPEDTDAHEYRSVRIFKKICAESLTKKLVEDDQPSAKEQEVIGKMITFSEDCKDKVYYIIGDIL